jgi:hypothetical protein
VTGALVVLGWWSRAEACAVCGAGGPNDGAYMDMTIFLSLLPLGILGSFAGVIFYLHRAASAASPDVARPDVRDA